MLVSADRGKEPFAAATLDIDPNHLGSGELQLLRHSLLVRRRGFGDNVAVWRNEISGPFSDSFPRS